MRNQIGLRPQDILILAKLLVIEKKCNQKTLAESLNISQAEISFSLERLKKSGLLDEQKESVNRLAALEFFEYAVKFFYPIEVGSIDRGIAIGPSSVFFRKRVGKDHSENFVWPCAEGKSRGQSVTPIYDSVPVAALRDEKLCHLLSVIDVLRGLGGVRHLKEAKNELQRLVLGDGKKY